MKVPVPAARGIKAAPGRTDRTETTDRDYRIKTAILGYKHKLHALELTCRVLGGP